MRDWQEGTQFTRGKTVHMCICVHVCIHVCVCVCSMLGGSSEKSRGCRLGGLR